MQFRHKIRKLVDGQSLASARKRTLRLLRANRFQLETKRVIETIDPVEFEQIRRRYRVADPGADWPSIWISIAGSELTSGGFASLNSTWPVPNRFSI